MADPEIELPRTSSTYQDSELGHSGQHSPFSEKTDKSFPTSKADVADWEAEPIVYHYLEWETELPLPARSSSYNAQAEPPFPDLKEYTSPFEWTAARKNLTIWLSCAATVVTAYTAGSYSPGIPQMQDEWHIGQVAALVGITTFTTGFGIAPMVLAPFSEINGRRPVFVITGALFVLCQLCCALTRSFAGMLVARFFVGAFSSTFSTMVGGVVSDIYHTEDRNTPMALFSGAALFGTGLGPLVSGFIAEATTWRWIFYHQTISCGIVILIVAIFFKETRGSVLLSRRAHKINKWYEAREQAGYYGFQIQTPSSKDTPGSPQPTIQRIRWKVKSDEDRASLTHMIGISLYRPFHLLLTEPVVFWFSMWVAFSWAVLYLTFGAIPFVFQSTYGFSIHQYESVFAAMCVGAILATILSISQERIAKRYGKLVNTPEGRLYFACIESALMPIGLFWFGWSASPSIPWIVPTIAVGCATMGIFSIYLAVFNYLADTYHRYASSALAAQSFCRNMLGGVFPLITNQMYRKMGTGGASSFLGGVGLGLTLVPWVLVLYGPRIRARSRFASEIMEG